MTIKKCLILQILQLHKSLKFLIFIKLNLKSEFSI